MGGYSERGRGGIYWSETDPHGPSPLQLVRLAAEEYPGPLLPGLRRVGSIEHSDLKVIVDRIPQDWMSETSRMFVLELMEYNRRELKKLLGEVAPCQ